MNLIESADCQQDTLINGAEQRICSSIMLNVAVPLKITIQSGSKKREVTLISFFQFLLGINDSIIIFI